MADYFKHWLSFASQSKLPRIYYVNWFLKGKQGEWLWPGFGENSRVLKWIFERHEGVAEAIKTPIGNIPALKDFDVSGLNISPEVLNQLFHVDKKACLADVEGLKKYLSQFGDDLPEAIHKELEKLKERLLKE
jgi:phosphoenolpyruvate carboxykinase (GTP)